MPRQAVAQFPFEVPAQSLRGSVLVYADGSVRLRVNKAPVVIDAAFITGYGAGHTKYSSVTLAPIRRAAAT
jgi:hypothetical protein